MDCITAKRCLPSFDPLCDGRGLRQAPAITTFLETSWGYSISATNRLNFLNAFSKVERALHEGHIVCIFPEGSDLWWWSCWNSCEGMELIIDTFTGTRHPNGTQGLWEATLAASKAVHVKVCPHQFGQKSRSKPGDQFCPKDTSCETLRQSLPSFVGRCAESRATLNNSVAKRPSTRTSVQFLLNVCSGSSNLLPWRIVFRYAANTRRIED